MTRRGKARDVIPNIELAKVYDPKFADAPVHYGAFGSMADFFGRDTPAHRHDRFYQLHFLETGTLRLTLDDIAHEGRAPLFFFTPPSVPHAFATEPSAAGHVITVAQGLVFRLFDDDQSLPRRHLAAPRCVLLKGGEGRHHARGLSRLFGLLRREIESSAIGTEACVEALVRLILVEIFRLSEESAEERPGSRHELVLMRRFTELIEAHFAEHWDLAAYAGALHVTEARLTDLCNRLAGKSPKRLALERVALEARRFLAFSGLGVGEIAGALGFEDPAYFCRFFKRREGVTPSEYRSRVARGNPA
jgi:AraC family 4-hydroxyphenylacetate 3-monooxygenase operon regulatory protein